MSVRLYLQKGWRRSISNADFLSLCEVPMAEDSHWSSEHGYSESKHLQIFQPIGNKHQLFAQNKVSPVW